MEYTTVIVDELGHIVAICSELTQEEIDNILENHSEYRISCEVSYDYDY